MELKKVLNGIEGLKAKGNLDVDINNIECDSKKITNGDMFVAIKGYDYDGHDYIDEAIENGARVIVMQEGNKISKSKINDDITIIMSENTRKVLAISACNFYKNPSTKFKLIGITGTKGKTTTAYMLKAILEKCNQKVGIIGTIANCIGEEKISESTRTTPESIELQRILAKMAEEKVDTVIMEVSSQSLKLNRVDGCDFDIGIFTNFSKDHISQKEHTDMEDYYNSKLKLFTMCKTAYINTDDFYVAKLKNKGLNCEINTFGVDNSADLIAKDITITNVTSDFKVKIGTRNERIKVSIPGRYSVYNSLAAISVALKFGADAEKIKEALVNISVPGRSEIVPNKRGLTIMIDYAHTPESLESILTTVKSYTKGKVISVFGCGGDRDTTKREIMGEIAGKIADYTVITSDNPRTEKPEEIIKQIEVGIKKTGSKYISIVDRIEAIKHAINIATKADIIVLAGKGHETYQEINGKKQHLDEREIINQIIK